jgi:hypothetical protein
MVSGNLAGKVIGWKQLDIDVFGSDHCGLITSFRLRGCLPEPPPSDWVKLVDKEIYRANLIVAIQSLLPGASTSALQTKDAIDSAVLSLREAIQSSAFSAASSKPRATRKHDSWWDEELERLYRTRLDAQKTYRASGHPADRVNFANSSKALSKAARSKKQNHFKSLCERLQKPWALYKLLSKKKGLVGEITLSNQDGSPIISDPDANAARLLQLFFPDDNPAEDSALHSSVRSYVQSVELYLFIFYYYSQRSTHNSKHKM